MHVGPAYDGSVAKRGVQPWEPLSGHDPAVCVRRWGARVANRGGAAPAHTHPPLPVWRVTCAPSADGGTLFLCEDAECARCPDVYNIPDGVCTTGLQGVAAGGVQLDCSVALQVPFTTQNGVAGLGLGSLGLAVAAGAAAALG